MKAAAVVVLALLACACRTASPVNASIPATTPPTVATTTPRTAEQQLAEMAVQFLTDFANSDVPPAVVVKNFHPGCEGTAGEWSDTVYNRASRRQLPVRLGTPRVLVFSERQRCALNVEQGQACLYVDVEWRGLVIGPPNDPHLGMIDHNTGTNQLTGEFKDGRWWLCSSSWFGSMQEFLPR